MRAFFILLISCFLFSCATTNYEQTVRSWRGNKTHTLLAQWGNPYFTDLSNSNHKLYVYSTQSFVTQPPPEYRIVPTMTVSNNRPLLVNVPTDSGPQRTRKCYITFIANKQDVIVSTTIHGNNCAPVPAPPQV